MRRSVLLVALSATGFAFGQGKTMSVNNMLVAGDWAYFVAPPKMVTDDLVDQFEIAPGGRYVLVWGSQLPGRKFAPLFDAMAGKTKPELPKPVLRIWDMERDSLVTVPLDPTKTSPVNGQLHWSARPGVAFQAESGDSTGDGKTVTTSAQLWKFNAADGTFKLAVNDLSTDEPSTEVRDLPSIEVFCSPIKPIVIMTIWSARRAPNQDGVQSTLKVRVYDLDGNLKKKTEIKQEGYIILGDSWLADGTHLVGANYKRGTNPDQRVQTKVIFDAITGTLTPTSEKLAIYEPAKAEQALSLTSGTVLAGAEKNVQKLNGLWLTTTLPSDLPNCLVSADYDGHAELLPDLKSLVYLSRGRLYSCEVAKIDKALYLQAKSAAERTAALSKAKQIGTAMVMFASDNNDNYPGQAGWQDAINPYLKNQDMMNGFVYTFKGGSATSLENPATTELGYFVVPGGRAVVMADTSARFIKDKP